MVFPADRPQRAAGSAGPTPYILPWPATKATTIAGFVAIVVGLGAGRLLNGLSGVPEGVAGPTMVLATSAPLIAAGVVSGISLGRNGLRDLRTRLSRWRVGIGWYALGLVAPTVVYGSLLLAWLASGGPQPVFDHDSLMMIPVVLLAGLPLALMEEIGWRGWLQRALQARTPTLVAALVVGVVWVSWHLPLHYLPEHALSGIPLGVYTPLLLGVSVIFAAIYNVTGGSIPVVAVAHVGFNLAVGLIVLALPEGRPLFVGLSAAITVLIAAGIAVATGSRLALPDGSSADR